MLFSLIRLLPGWVFMAALLTLLRAWVDVPHGLLLVIWTAWVVKDLALLPGTRAVARSKPKTGLEGLIGQTGVVRKSLEPEGWVSLQGALWRAEAVPEELRLPTGLEVRVENVRGLTLLVRPASAAAP